MGIIRGFWGFTGVYVDGEKFAVLTISRVDGYDPTLGSCSATAVLKGDVVCPHVGTAGTRLVGVHGTLYDGDVQSLGVLCRTVDVA